MEHTVGGHGEEERTRAGDRVDGHAAAGHDGHADRAGGQAAAGHGLNAGPIEAGEGASSHGLAHIMPKRALLLVWGALVVLTWITVSVTRFNLGSLNLWVAMGIATTKATLVALYFMHLRYDRPINGIVFIGTLLFATLFIGLALTDTQSYQPDLIPGYSPGMTGVPGTP